MLSTQIEQFRIKLKHGPVYGPFSKSCDAAFVEVLGHAGFDFVVLDQEHGPSSFETLTHLIRGAQCCGVLPIVRTPSVDEEAISKALDLGAAGIQVPQVTTADQVCAVVRAARFADAGQRGVCCFVRAARYSALPIAQYFKAANEALIIIQLEGREALENLDEIISVEGFDILFIGPYDLSQSLGVPGQVEHPLVVEAMKNVIARCHEKNITVGTFVNNADASKRWGDAGVKYIGYSVDIRIFHEACRAICNQQR